MDREVDAVVSRVGNLEETDGLVRNDAAKSIEHLIGHKMAEELGETLATLQCDDRFYSSIFKDKGLRLKAVTAISEKGRVTDFPKDSGSVYTEFEQFMTYCDVFKIAPTIGLFAAWLGVSFNEFESIKLHYEDVRPDCASALDVCKEVLRGFLETKTLDGDIPPAVYLHQNKAYYEAAETAPVKREKGLSGHVRDMSQIAEVIDLLPE